MHVNYYNQPYNLPYQRDLRVQVIPSTRAADVITRVNEHTSRALWQKHAILRKLPLL